MALIKSIPKELRDEMDADPFYHVCCLTGLREGPGVEIQWHHNFKTYMFGNRGRLNEKWCILPVSKDVHAKADTRETRERLDWVMLNRADGATLVKYSKVTNLLRERERLNNKFGEYVERK